MHSYRDLSNGSNSEAFKQCYRVMLTSRAGMIESRVVRSDSSAAVLSGSKFSDTVCLFKLRWVPLGHLILFYSMSAA